MGGKLSKLQVRNAQQQLAGLPLVSLRCNQGKSRLKPGSFDFIVGFDIFTDTAYVWSWRETEHLRGSVTICPDAAERWDKLHGSVA